MIIIGTLSALFIVFQVYTIMSSHQAKEQPYKVVRVEKDYEVRFYPSATIAKISSSAVSYRELASSGFTKLAGYIFGGNDIGKKIAMTAPVHMDINDSLSSMSFVMPAEYTPADLPKPNDSQVTIETLPEEYVAVISFSGFATDRKIKQYSERLEALLKQSQLTFYGHYRYLGYNPPYQLLGRRNEIIIRLNWTSNQNSK